MGLRERRGRAVARRRPIEPTIGTVEHPPLPPHIFRAYDVRGLAGDELTPDVVYRTARALGTFLRRRFQAQTAIVALRQPSQLAGAVRGGAARPA